MRTVLETRPHMRSVLMANVALASLATAPLPELSNSGSRPGKAGEYLKAISQRVSFLSQVSNQEAVSFCVEV